MSMDDQAIVPGRSQRPDAYGDPRLDWWREAKFGMFIHWGLYAIPAGVWKGEEIPGIGEWIMHRARIPVSEYQQLAAQFNPVKFDAAEVVALAKRAGQKYLVITAKHHDGFCMYETDMTDYNIVDATLYGRDPMVDLARECERQGVRMAFYYSQTQDWHHPDGVGNDWDYDESRKDFQRYIDNYVKAQVTELLTRYGPIALIWFDTPMGISEDQSRSLVELVHQVQPDCLVCGRIGNALGDYASARDNRIPGGKVLADWETPATINDTWGYKENDHNWKSSSQLIRHLVDIASKGGNYLLNIGPTAEGVVPQPSAERLQNMGDWLAIYGESIYGTRAGPLQGGEWYRTTARPGKVYLHVFDWPRGGELRIPALPAPVSGAYMLDDATAAPLDITGADGELVVQGPADAPNPYCTVIVLSAQGEQ